MFRNLAFLCIFLAITLFIYDAVFDKKPEVKAHKKVINDDTDNINFRLQNAESKRRLKELKLKNSFDNEVLTGKIENDLKSHKLKVPKGLDDRIDTTLQDVYNDLNLGKTEDVRQKLEDEVQRSLSEIEEQSQLEAEEKELFIRSFIENARKRGIDIQIDENMNVYTK